MPYVHPEYLVSPEQLAERLGHPKLRVFDSTVFLKPSTQGGFKSESGLQRFREGHVPGSMFLDLIDAASDTSTGLHFTLPAVSQLQALFRRLGIDDDSEVVLYSSGNMMWATRAWWLLHYCGHGNARVLDGGYSAWKSHSLPVSTEESSYPEGSFRARAKPHAFVTQETVLAAISEVDSCTVNALSPEMHSGESDISYGRKGHIAGSVNVFYDDLLLDGCFRDAKSLRQALEAKGLLSASKVIAYCGGGIAATVDAFACLLLGQEEVSVYDGSLTEWVRDESLPMEGPLVPPPEVP